MRTHLILSTTPASDGLGDAGEDTLNRAFREHRQRFLDMWKSLISILDDHNITGGSRGFTSVVGSGDKQNVKDSLGAFFGRYEELEAACKQHPLTRQDPTLREKLAAETRGLVTDALQSYANRHQKHVEKCEFGASSPIRHAILTGPPRPFNRHALFAVRVGQPNRRIASLVQALVNAETHFVVTNFINVVVYAQGALLQIFLPFFTCQDESTA